jgi:hypothetical protein
VARSLGSHKLPRSGIFWRFGAQRLLLRRFVTRHEHPTRGKHRLVFNYFNASQSPIVARRRTNERTNERYLCYSHTVTPPPQTLNQNHHLTHGQKCWQSACASSAVTHDACLAGCW